MNAVGKVGTFFAQGVYTFSGPFHPFGGAVDIIVVQQEDGTFKSSPWYVKFGKFQGVLKRREKKVVVAVNDDDANFHMYLDHKGEAYFLKDAQGEEVVAFSPTEAASSGDENSSHMLALEYPRVEEGANPRPELGKEESEDDKEDDLELRFEGRDASKQLIQQSVEERATAGLAGEEMNSSQGNYSGYLEIRGSSRADEESPLSPKHEFPDTQAESPEAGRKAESSNGKVMHTLLNTAIGLEAGVKSTAASAVLANAALTALQTPSFTDDVSFSTKEAATASTKVRRMASTNGAIIHGLLNQAIGLQPSHKSGPASGLMAAAVLASLQTAVSDASLITPHNHVVLVELAEGADLNPEKNHEDASPGSPVGEIKEEGPALDSTSNPNAAYSVTSNGNTSDDVTVMKTVSSLGRLSGSEVDQPDGEVPIRSDSISPPRSPQCFDVMKTLEVKKLEILDKTLVVEVQEHVDKGMLASVGNDEAKDIVDADGRVETIVVDRKEVMERVHDLQGSSVAGGIPSKGAGDPELASDEDKSYDKVSKLVSIHVDKRLVDNLQEAWTPKIDEGPKLEKEKDISNSDKEIVVSNAENAQDARNPEVMTSPGQEPRNIDRDRVPPTPSDRVQGDSTEDITIPGKELALPKPPVNLAEVSSPRMKAAIELEIAWREVMEKAATNLKGAPYTTGKKLSHSLSYKKKGIENGEKKKPDSPGRAPQQQSERKSWGGWFWGGSSSAPQSKQANEQGSSKDGKNASGESSMEPLDVNHSTELSGPSGMTSEKEDVTKNGTHPMHDVEGSDSNAEADERGVHSESDSGPTEGGKAGADNWGARGKPEDHQLDLGQRKGPGGPPPRRRSWIGLLSRTSTNQSSLSSASSLRSNDDELLPVCDGSKEETVLERAENVVDLFDERWAKGSEAYRAIMRDGRTAKHEQDGTVDGETTEASSAGARLNRIDGAGNLLASADPDDGLKGDGSSHSHHSSIPETTDPKLVAAQPIRTQEENSSIPTSKCDQGTIMNRKVGAEDGGRDQQVTNVTRNGSDAVTTSTPVVSANNPVDVTSTWDKDVLLMSVGGRLVRAPVGLSDNEAPLLADDKSNEVPLLADDKSSEGPLLADEKSSEGSLLADDKSIEVPLLADDKSGEGPLLADDTSSEGPLLADDKSSEVPLVADDKSNEVPLLADAKSNEVPLLSDESVKLKRGGTSPQKLVCFASVPDEIPDTHNLAGNGVQQTQEGTGTQVFDAALGESDGHVLRDASEGKTVNPGCEGLKGLAKLTENDSVGVGQQKMGSFRLATESTPDQLGPHSESGETPKINGHDESGIEIDASGPKEFDAMRAMVFGKLDEPFNGDALEEADDGKIERYYSSKDLTEVEEEQEKRASKLKRNLSVYVDAISGEDEQDSTGSAHEDDLGNQSRDKSGPIGIPGALDWAQSLPSEKNIQLPRSASESLPNTRHILVDSEMVSPRLTLSRSLDSAPSVLSSDSRQQRASSDGVLTARPSSRSPVNCLGKGAVGLFVVERTPEMGKADSEQSKEGMHKFGTQTSTSASSSSSMEDGGKVPEIGFELSLCRHLLKEMMGLEGAAQAFTSEKITLEEYKKSGSAIAANDKLVVRVGGRYYPWAVAAPIVLGILAFGQVLIAPNEGAIAVEQPMVAFDGKAAANTSTTISGGGWKLWPFGAIRRPKTPEKGALVSREAMILTEAALKSSVTAEYLRMAGYYKRPRKVRTNSPSSQQLASLNLKEGSNKITFTFETRVWGKQQVDARIYLWKWNTRIVISDVDGTITKSDVLGQVMPLMGKDWTQIGVARLFSAIKKNGYELMFLSARAISQAYLTRQFLDNIKQDGEVLPDGPVVISPDGLFPSLYREVIRRAPHEFKIACLEDIKSLFPPESKPFYAGFGNRDTDELSYLKVGISKGKIFIINPKGEVVVNNQVDVKSYTSLHKLVDDMFPAMSFTEQEDYNEWNFWKLPLPDIGDELSVKSVGSSKSRRSVNRSGRRS